MNPAAMVAALEEERNRITLAIAALKPLVQAGPSTPTPPLAVEPKKPKAWKHRRRCQKCEQLTATDPCQHCGTKIAPPGARDLKL